MGEEVSFLQHRIERYCFLNIVITLVLKTLLVVLNYPNVFHPGRGMVLLLLSNFPRVWFISILKKRKKIWESDRYFALGVFSSWYSILIIHIV